ncbi:MAG TPA: knotted carbamoyltransferase YgeW [Thermoanaerobaculia bacterium]
MTVHPHIAPFLENIDDAALDTLHGRSMLLTDDWTRPQIEALCGVAEAFEQLDRRGIPTRFLEGELHYAIFFDNSTRTKSSWAGAAARLGAHPMVVDGSSTQVAHGETAEETGAMLGMNAHALGIRHDRILGEGSRFLREVKEGIDAYLRYRGDDRVVPVVNLQCDVDHPTQTLADLCWLRARFPEGLAGKTIAVSWAYSPSYAKPLSVPQGLITLLTRFGMNVRLAYPRGYELMPRCVESAAANATDPRGSFRVMHDMDDAFASADVVYPKSWGPYDLMLERVGATPDAMTELERQALERNREHIDWICDERRMRLTRDALYMHCLPADIGAEVAPSVLESFRHSLAREANKKLYVVMALLAVAKVKRLRERLSR